MKGKNKKTRGFPEEFRSLDEAGEFWDKHDTTDHLELLTPVTATAKLQKRHFEIEVDPELAALLRKRATKINRPVNRLVNELLRASLSSPAGG